MSFLNNHSRLELEEYAENFRFFAFIVEDDVVYAFHLPKAYKNAERLGNALASNPKIVESNHSAAHYGWKYDGENFIAPENEKNEINDAGSWHFAIVIDDNVFGALHFKKYDTENDRIVAGLSSNPKVIEVTNPLIDFGWKYDGENFIAPEKI